MAETVILAHMGVIECKDLIVVCGGHCHNIIIALADHSISKLVKNS